MLIEKAKTPEIEDKNPQKAACVVISPADPLLSINNLIELVGSRSTAYNEIKTGRLKTVLLRSRRYSTLNQWNEYLKLLEKEAEENFQDQLPKPKKKADKEAAA